MDDARIQQLRAEVLGQLRGRVGGAARLADLEARVAALEARGVRGSQAGAARAGPRIARAAEVHVHPSLRCSRVLNGPAGPTAA